MSASYPLVRFREILRLVFFFAVSAGWAAPTITVQPKQRQVATLGGSVTLSVSAVGSDNLSYQWSRNGLPMAGKTENSLIITNVQYNDRGHYLVKVSDATGTTRSSAGFLNVLVSPLGLRGWKDSLTGAVTFPAGFTDVVALATNEDHTLALKSDGTVVGWGDNSDGELSIPAGLSGVVDIVTTDMLSVALKSDGTVVGWGSPFYVNRLNGLSSVVALAMGERVGIALKADGTYTSFLGIPYIPDGIPDIAAFALGGSMHVALKTDGTVASWGIPHTLPAGISGIVAIAAGDFHGLALKSDGTVIGWSATSSGAPSTPPPGLTGIVSIAAVSSKNYAIKSDGTVVGWTADFFGLKILPLPDGLSGVKSIIPSVARFSTFNLAITQLSPVIIAAHPGSQIKNPGSDVTFSVAVTGSFPLTYQWRKNGQSIPNATSASYTISPAQESHEGSYDVVVTNELGSATSNVATLSINDPVIITASPQPVTVNQDQSANFAVAAIGTAPLAYQWKKNGININGASGTTLNISSAQLSDTATYQCEVSNIVGPVLSNAAALVVIDPPVIYLQPEDITASPGVPVHFTVGTAAVQATYQWRRNGINIANAFSNTYLIFLSEEKEGAYDVVVTNAAGTVTSNRAILTVNDPVVLTSQPQSMVQMPGGAASFTLTATGTAPFAYQWQKNGVNIAGATNSIYSIASVSSVNAGIYVCAVSNVVGTVTTTGAELSIGPAITNQPLDRTVNPGTAASFSVVATGTGVINYQWRKNTIPINGAISASYTISTAAENDQASYDVVLTNIAGSVTSNPALLAVNDPIQITTQPLSMIVNPAAPVSFSITAAGTGPLTYQWRKNGVSILGATSAGYFIPSVSKGAAGSYDVVVGNIVGNVTSALATLAVNSPLEITAQPIGKTVNPSASVSFSVTVAGTGPINYQWRKNTVPIGGAIDASYTISSATESDQASYDVVASNIVGSVASNPAALIVNDPIQITAQPLAKTVNPAAAASFSVTAMGTGPMTYQWKRNEVAIGGATGASYSIPTVSENDEGAYNVVVTNIVGSVTSNPAILAVNDPIQITVQPLAMTVNPAASASLSVKASGTGPIAYQWRKNTMAISGAVNENYAIPSVMKSDEGTYEVVVTNIAGSVTSKPVALAVNDPIRIIMQPMPITVNPAASAGFSVTVEGTAPIAYQWRKNGMVISGASSASYVISSVLESDEGSYDVVITNIAGNLTSSPAELAVNDPIQITVQPIPVVVHEGSTASFTVTAAGSAPLSYQWEHDRRPINGAIGATLTISNAVSSDDGSYRCTITNVVGSTLSDAVNLEVRLRPRIVEQPRSSDVKPNANVVFTVQATGYSPITYQWKKDGTTLPEQTGSTLTLSNVTSLDAGRYSVTVANEVSSIESAGAELRFVVWTDVDGTYQSLLLHDNTLNPEEPAYPGRLTVTVSGGGGLSAKLDYKGLAYSFTGKFTPELNFQRTIARKGQEALELQMHLDASGHTLMAALKETLPAGVFQSGSLLFQQPGYSNQQSGRYTVRMNPSFDGEPQAAGYAVVVIGAPGSVRITGRLPDGSLLSNSALLHEDGSAACYDALYKTVFPNAGYLAGSLRFARQGALQAVEGTLEWSKPARAKEKFWPLGFTRMLTVEGSFYSSPLRGQRVLNLPANDTLGFRANAQENATMVHLTAANRFLTDLPNPTQMKLTLDPATGIVRGTFREPGTGKKRRLEGVTLQAQQEFSGFFLRDDDAINWLLTPP
ncbi:MAG: C-terminal target protein [Chthoniobacteraceae bacterium]|nr:C-terminal target protein [Chthoniobacteraceae bacterium]